MICNISGINIVDVERVVVALGRVGSILSVIRAWHEPTQTSKLVEIGDMACPKVECHITATPLNV